jgi:hypothetical protein
MPSSPPPLWDGYDDADEDQLVALLERKATTALDSDDPTVDEKVSKDLAQAVASHEWLKQKLGADGYRPKLHALADDIRVGSWRPK